MELESRQLLAKYITKQRERLDAAAQGGAVAYPAGDGGGGGSCSVNFSALLKVLFSITAFLGSVGYFALFCYALVLSALMADVCEGNLLPLLGYVLLLWVWLVVALLTGVPMACFTWLRWHGCNSSDYKDLLYPTQFAVPPVPPAPPPVTKPVRRLPAANRGTASTPAPAAAAQDPAGLTRTP